MIALCRSSRGQTVVDCFAFSFDLFLYANVSTILLLFSIACNILTVVIRNNCTEELRDATVHLVRAIKRKVSEFLQLSVNSSCFKRKQTYSRTVDVLREGFCNIPRSVCRLFLFSKQLIYELTDKMFFVDQTEYLRGIISRKCWILARFLQYDSFVV